MRSHDIRVDVAGLVDLEGKLETAATVHLPDKVDGPLTLLVGYPGGGYSRGYYDIRRLPGYSQAEHHVDRGFAFVACDHLGIGDSSLVDSFDLTFERLAAANHATASAVTEGLRTGSLIHGVAPMEIGRWSQWVNQWAVACSPCSKRFIARLMGSLSLAIVASSRACRPGRQPDHLSGPASRLGPACRGESVGHRGRACGTHSLLLSCGRRGTRVGRSRHALIAGRRTPSMADRQGTRVRSGYDGRGVVAQEAAAIDVPVLVGCGEIDVVPDPWAEPLAYRGSRDVSLIVVPGMAHMHNFARTREKLWDRIDHFARHVAGI